MADFTTPEAKKLNSILSSLQEEIKTLKAGATTPQLTHSSIDVNEGRGFIPVIENGEVKMRIGRQPDGSIATVSEGSGVPPVLPYAPLCTPVLGGVQVRCQGFISKQFADFGYVKVYRDQAYYGNIIKVPGSIVVAPLSPGDHQFKLSSVNLAGQESTLTEAVISAPKQAIEEDIADGIITTLKIANEAITDAKVAVDAIKQENIAPQAVGSVEIIDGAVNADKIAANSITSGKIAANAVVASNIAAEAIQALNIAAGAITADKIAANAITTDKIVANAITSLQIAANAVQATNIQAGAIDATKLAAQMVLASTQIIVGSLTGQRLVLDTQGLTQYNSRGDLILQFGAQANKSNYLTIMDPSDPTNALSAIGNDGSLSVTGLTANGKVQINGVDIIQYLNSLPRGILAYGRMAATTPFVGSAYGVFELQFDAVAGRKYKICSTGININMNADATTIWTCGSIQARFTLNGTVPTLNSEYAPGSFMYFSCGIYDTTAYRPYGYCTSGMQAMISPATSGRARVLFYIQPSVNNTGPISMLGPVDFWVEDLGFIYANTGGNNPGGGTSQANGTYVTTFPCVYSGYAYDTNTFGGSPNPNMMFGAGTYVGQLNGANYYSRLDFNYSTIQSTLAGATIHKVELYMYSYYWTLATGGWVSLGYHNDPTIAGSYNYVARNSQDFKMAKPDGQWLNLLTGFGVGFRDGWLKGLVLDNRGSVHNAPDNYGQFRRGGGADGAEVSPVLRITYTK